VLFDGFTVYDVDHFFGVFSAFNPNAVENVTMVKGGYESKYGERLSSVIDMTGKTTSRDGRPTFGAGISFLSFNGYADVPLGSKGGFRFAGRKSFQSPFSDKIRDTYSDAGPSRSPGGRGFEGFSTDPESSFRDINARGVYSVTPKDDVVISFYQGKDVLDNSRSLKFVLPPTDEGVDNEDSTGFQEVSGQIINLTDWGNTGFSGSWFRNWNDSFFTKFTFGHSRYFKDYERRTDLSIVGEEETDGEEERPVFAGGSLENNRLEDYTLKVDNHWNVNPQHGLEFGVLTTNNYTKYDFDLGDDIAAFDRYSQGSTYAVYVQDTWRPFHRLSVTPGVRPIYYELTEKTYFDPRLAFVFHINDKLRLKASGGQYHQFANRLVREDPLGGDQDFWMMSDGDLIPVGEANHYIAGASYETRGFLIDVEAYRKDLSGLSDFAS
jgi:outer membrane receptor protein involved in Fe transport